MIFIKDIVFVCTKVIYLKKGDTQFLFFNKKSAKDLLIQ